MTENRLPAAWLRPLLGMFAIAGVLALSACGGGSGAPNNPYAPGPVAPGPLTVLPPDATVYSGVPTTLTITRRRRTLLRFLQQPRSPAGDAGRRRAIRCCCLPPTSGPPRRWSSPRRTMPEPRPSRRSRSPRHRSCPTSSRSRPNGDCSVGNSLCSGGTGTASVVVTAPGGGGIPGRQVRFDVVFGAYAIQTSNPSAPLASTLTVVTDQNGTASVGIAVNANAPTQIATIRATDVTTGNQVTGNFLIQEVTDGSQILSVIPTRNGHHRRSGREHVLERRRRPVLHLRRHAALQGRGDRSREWSP